MSNLSLYHIEKEYQALASEIIEAGGELTPELETALAINKDSLQLKAVQFALIIKDQENDIEVVKKEINRLQGLKSSREKSNERLEAIIKAAMELYGVMEIKGENFKLSFRKSTALKITDESKIPAYFKEKVPESWKIINADVKTALTKGEIVEGAELVNNKNLQIK
jgi:Siphovirus Gp157